MENNQRDQLFEVINRLKKVKHAMPSFEGLSQGEFIMMHMIAHRIVQKENKDEDDSGIKVSNISSQMHMSKPAVSQMLNSLENKGFIERKATKHDRRVILINLTTKGHNLLDENNKKLLALADEIIEKFGEKDMQAFISLLNKLYDILESMNDSN